MTQEHQFIAFTQTDGRAVLTLRRPPLNIMTIPMIEEINHALAALRGDHAAKVLLIRGEGRCFSAGMDVADHLPDKVEHMLRAFHRTIELMRALEIPTVSAVHGATLGGGLELAVATDLTFAATGATLGQPEIKLGVFPPLAVAYYARLTGLKRAYDLILTGRNLTAEEAHHLGLVNAVFPEGDFAARVDEITRTLAGYSRPILLATKRAIREAAQRPLAEALSLAEHIYLQEVMATEDALEGLTAFLEKRAPQWKER